MIMTAKDKPMRVTRLKKLIDEKMLIDDLEVPFVSSDERHSAENTFMVAACAVLAGFDQEITREHFFNIVRYAMRYEMYATSSRILGRVKEGVARGADINDVCVQSIIANENACNSFRIALQDYVKLLVECRSDSDKVN